jgi:hypothetical protein
MFHDKLSKNLQPQLAKPSRGVNWGGDLREAQVDVPRLLAIPAFDRIAGLYNRYLNSNGNMLTLTILKSG